MCSRLQDVAAPFLQHCYISQDENFFANCIIEIIRRSPSLALLILRYQFNPYQINPITYNALNFAVSSTRSLVIDE
jgi:hypothetical protein